MWIELYPCDEVDGIVLALGPARMPGGSEKTNFRWLIFSEENILKNHSGFLDESRNRGANPTRSGPARALRATKPSKYEQQTDQYESQF